MPAPVIGPSPDWCAPTDPRSVRPPAPPAGDILDLIDDAVAHRCACGCRAVLDPDGPSQWYASADCQRRWQEQHATDPGDVYRRRDAAYVVDDHRPAPLLEAGPAPRGLLDVLLAPQIRPDEDGMIRVQLHTSSPWAGACDPEVGDPWSAVRAESVRRYASGGAGFVAATWIDETRGWLDESHIWNAAHVHVPAVRCEQRPGHDLDLMPTDPMERALWLRRNRNTGPKRPARAPKRIDARRSR